MYTFEANIKTNINENKEFLIFFSGQLEGESFDYSDYFDKELFNHLKPDAIIFIYPEYLTSLILPYFEMGKDTYENITRHGDKVPVLLFSFNEEGTLNLAKSIIGMLYEFDDYEGLSSTIVEEGLLNLATNNKNGVLQKSPAGTVFSKPSGKTSEEFIKASELAKNYSEHQFVAFCLLRKKPDIKEIRNIYIDTASIASYIEPLIYYLCKFKSCVCKDIGYHSFSSYEGLEYIKPDDEKSVWVIISASVGNSLYRKITSDWKLNADQAVTILTFCDDERSLLNIEHLSDAYQNNKKIDSAVKVQVTGENFTAEIAEPNTVIVKSLHKPRYLNKLVKRYYLDKVFKCNKIVPGGKKPQPIFVELNDKVVLDPEVINWVDKIITWYLPQKLDWIIVNDDVPSQTLLKLFENRMSENGYSHESKIVNFKQARDVVNGNGAVLVLQPVTGGGRSLLNLNRELRLNKHDGNRIFVSPFVVSSSKDVFIKLKNSLLFGPDNLKYLFLNYYELYIGHTDYNSSWQMEKKVVSELSEDNDFWIKRAEKLDKEGFGLENEIAINLSESQRKLSFSQGFAFWDDWNTKYDPINADHEAIYITIAATLQNLRELSSENEDSLQSHIYKHSVLDPENFTRFNDPILQSCIWRSANITELDYRRSEELCNSMVDILLRLCADMDSNKSESAIDLLMGVATNKIKISKHSMLELVRKSKSLLVNHPDAALLVKYIENQFIK